MYVRTFAILTVLITVVGCGTSSKGVYLSDKRFESRASDHPIEILRGEAARPHIVIGRIIGSEPSGMMKSVADGRECIREMKRRAREMGGDAIVKFEVYRSGTNQTEPGKVTAQGYLVRWK